jgi:guanylate kinase
MRAVILYGPPASGKDTITRALSDRNGNYRLYQRLKVGAGRTDGYRLTTRSHLDELRKSGEIVWENRRYNAVYAIGKTSLAEEMRSAIPVVHLGQAEAVATLTNAVPGQWIVAYLWCSREVAETRIIERNTGDTEDRLRAWDETKPLTGADILIDTGVVDPEQAARMIDMQVQALSE